MLRVEKLSFAYDGGDKKQVDDVSFTLEPGKVLALIGESGSGKSTLLKLIYGVRQWEEGKMYYKDRELLGPEGNLVPGEEEFKYLAQDFGLMPFATVEENVGSFLSNIYINEKKERVLELLNLVGMGDFAKARANDLSGGQKQRVAMAKTLAQVPELMILDEPFSQIDTFQKNILKRSVFQFARENGISILIATHEVDDSLAYADETMIFRDGKVEQYGKSYEVFKHPKNLYVAHLYGDVNVFEEGEVSRIQGEGDILVYSHQFSVSGTHGMEDFEAKVTAVYFFGEYYLLDCVKGDKQLWVRTQKPYSKGSTIYVSVIDYHTYDK